MYGHQNSGALLVLITTERPIFPFSNKHLHHLHHLAALMSKINPLFLSMVCAIENHPMGQRSIIKPNGPPILQCNCEIAIPQAISHSYPHDSHDLVGRGCMVTPTSLITMYHLHLSRVALVHTLHSPENKNSWAKFQKKNKGLTLRCLGISK